MISEPRKRFGSALHHALVREPEFLEHLLGGDAEMGHDGAHDQARDRDLHQGPQEGMEHPGLVAAQAVCR